MSSSISKAERSYIQSSLKATPSLRADGRSLLDYRTILLETGVAPLTNGSAKLNIGKGVHEGGGGTEVLAATKLEVESVEAGDGIDGGRMSCTVTCSPSAYPHLSSNALDELQYDLTTILHQTLAHPTLHPSNLGILPGRKSWLLHLDVVIFSDAGNVYDAIFMAARAALWDTKVPRTRPVQYRAPRASAVGKSVDHMAVDDENGEHAASAFDTRQAMEAAADFELPDYWDEGETLDGKDRWPVAVTLNLLSPVDFLDATLSEEASTPLKLLFVFSFPQKAECCLHAIRLLGPGEIKLPEIKLLLRDGEKYAKELFAALEHKLRDEDIRRNVKVTAKFAMR